LVPKAGLEPARLAAGDFESPASTIPPLGPIFSARSVYFPRELIVTLGRTSTKKTDSSKVLNLNTRSLGYIAHEATGK
jgi:hypothetical protein